MNTTLILGAGVMGSAFSFPLADSGGRVLLVGTHLDAGEIASIRETGAHPRLPSPLPPAVEACRIGALDEALDAEPDLVVLGVSSAGVPWAVETLAAHLSGPVPIVMLTKGLAAIPEGTTTLAGADNGTAGPAAAETSVRILPHVVAQGLAAARGWDPPVLHVGAVGGPCVAVELAMRHETAVVIAGDAGLTSTCAGRLAAPYYHVTSSDDLAGVELCAALKNFFAIGVGTARSKDSGHNPMAALFTQASAELEYLTGSLGGWPETARGLAGVGDLHVTCQAGRNSRLGNLLGGGMRCSDARREMAGETVEGADLAVAVGPVLRAMMDSGQLHAGRLPLTRAILSAVCDNAPFRYDWPDSGRS